jgi:DNA-binding MarR family transcriptional regulator
VSASPPTSEHAVDTAIRYFGHTVSLFDPLRFRAWAEMGLTTAQLRVLFLVREAPGVTAGELAQRIGVTPPTISGIVDRLVKMDLVRREDDESDRRLVRNFLTEQGAAVCSRLEQGTETFTRRILIEMNQNDLEALVTGLRAFVTASEYVSRVEPDLAAVAMPGLKNT